MQVEFGDEVTTVDRDGIEDRIDEKVLAALGDDDLLDTHVTLRVECEDGCLKRVMEVASSLDGLLRGGAEGFLVIEIYLAKTWELANIEGVVSIAFWGSDDIPDLQLEDPVVDQQLTLDETDWHEQLRAEEIVDIDGRPYPLLAGLRRLAKPFILNEFSKVTNSVVEKQVKRTLKRWNADEDGKPVIAGAEEVLGVDYFPYSSVTFIVVLQDGRQFTDSADAWLGNCDKLGHYPTAVASARAEGRVLRKILGIKEHVAEELSSKDAIKELTNPDDNPIAPEQKKLIENLVHKIEGANLKTVFEKVSPRDITGLDELTGAEATAAIKMLNAQKKKAK